MTRKHFQAFADEIKHANMSTEADRIEFARATMRVCAANSANFDRRRFLGACGFDAATIARIA